MINKVLETVNIVMKELGVNYFYMVNDSETITYPYCTGEFFESKYSNENAMTTGQLLLEIWTRGNYADINSIANSIKLTFDMLQIVDDDIAIAFEYNSMSPERQENNELKKIQIYLDIVYWKGQ